VSHLRGKPCKWNAADDKFITVDRKLSHWGVDGRAHLLTPLSLDGRATVLEVKRF
jgi:hypothetical protein